MTHSSRVEKSTQASDYFKGPMRNSTAKWRAVRFLISIVFESVGREERALAAEYNFNIEI